jgi:hypothetical protein
VTGIDGPPIGPDTFRRKARNVTTTKDGRLIRRAQFSMTKIASVGTGIICAAVAFAFPVSADPTPGHYVNVRTPSPPMRCQVGSDDRDGGSPAVVCQTAGFPQAPMDPVPYPEWHGDPSVLHQDQAIIAASGQFSWRTANLGLAPPGQPDITLAEGQIYNFEGWKIVPTGDHITFTNDATGHGMAIDRHYNVRSF